MLAWQQTNVKTTATADEHKQEQGQAAAVRADLHRNWLQQVQQRLGCAGARWPGRIWSRQAGSSVEVRGDTSFQASVK